MSAEITQPNSEITLKQLLFSISRFGKQLKKKWALFLVCSIAGMGMGIFLFIKQSPKYTGSCTFILEEKAGGGGGLAGLASQIGLDLGGISGSGFGLFSGDNILEIIPSRNIIEKVLLSRVDSSSPQTLADLFIDFTKLKASWNSKPRLANISFAGIRNPQQMSLIQDSLLNVVYMQVIKKYLTVDWTRKKASLITVTAVSKNEKFSKYLAERVVNESKKLYIELKTGPSQANVNRLQSKADSLLALLNDKSYQTAGSQILNANPAMKIALVPTEISTREKTMIGTIYAEMVKNLETSKILLSQQTPVIQVLDNTDFPLINDHTSLLAYLFAGCVLPALFLFIYFLTIQVLKKLKELYRSGQQ